jgi:hypothetical protein
MARSSIIRRNLVCGTALLLLAGACQSGGDAPAPQPAPPPVAAQPKPVEAPLAMPEPSGDPISLTPSPKSYDQVAAYVAPAPGTQLPDGQSPSTLPDPTDVLSPAADPCVDPGLATGTTQVSTVGGPQTASGYAAPSPNIGELRSRLPAAIPSIAVRRMVREHLGVAPGGTGPARVTTDSGLESVEHSARTGALAIARWRQLIRGFPFTGEELKSPLSDADKDNSPRRRALLYSAASNQQVPTAVAEVFKIALDLARPNGLYALTVALYGPQIQRWKASFALRWIGYEAGPAQFLLGARCDAREWRRYMEGIAPSDANTRRTLRRFWLLEALAGVVRPSDVDTAEVRAWQRVTSAQGADGAYRKKVMTYLLLDATGFKLHVPDWEAVLGSAKTGAGDADLARAAAHSQADEVVALSAILIGSRLPGSVEPRLLAQIVSSLKQAGLDKEAHHLAVEAAIDARL